MYSKFVHKTMQCNAMQQQQFIVYSSLAYHFSNGIAAPHHHVRLDSEVLWSMEHTQTQQARIVLA
jgi:hypothetical protein